MFLNNWVESLDSSGQIPVLRIILLMGKFEINILPSVSIKSTAFTYKYSPSNFD